MTAAMFQTMQNALVEQKQNPLSVDDVTTMIAGQIGQLAPMDKAAADLFRKLAKKIIEQAGKQLLAERKIQEIYEGNHTRFRHRL